MTRKRRTFLAAAVVVAIVVGVVVFTCARRAEQSAAVRVSGNIEVTDVPLSFKSAGRLQQRLAGEGDRVRRGQVVARLDPVDQQSLVARAEAELAYATAVLDELQAGSRPEDIRQAEAQLARLQQRLKALETGSRRQQIEASRAEALRARAALEAASAQLDQARSDEARFASLVDQGGVSRRDYELHQTQLETALSAEAEARARLESAEAQMDLVAEGPRTEEIGEARAAVNEAVAALDRVRNGPRAETIAAARARVAAAGEALNLARQQLADLELAAPMDAVVLYESAEPGAFLAPGAPVMVVGDLDRPWLRGYVNGVDLGRIRLGQTVRVTVDAFPERPVEGTLSYIAGEAEFTPKTVQTEEERVRLMYRIKVDLPNPDGLLKPGMPADAVIAVDG